MRTRILIPAILILLFGTCRTGFSSYTIQEESKKSPDFSFTCTQNNKEFVLKTRLSFWTGERDVPISGAAITYYNMEGEEPRQLEVVRTDMNGVAVYRIEKGSDKLLSVDDIYTFKSLFKGSSEYEMSEDFAEVKPLQMHLEFIEIDSVRTIVAEASETDVEGNPVPLEDADIYFYAQRSFSLLPVGEEWFVGGQAQVNFPASLPGDPKGTLPLLPGLKIMNCSAMWKRLLSRTGDGQCRLCLWRREGDLETLMLRSGWYIPSSYCFLWYGSITCMYFIL